MIWMLAILLPFALAFAFPALGRRPGRDAVLLGAAALPALLTALTGAGAGEDEAPWILLGSSFGLDETRRVVLAFAALLWGAAGVHAGAGLAGDSSRGRFGFFFLLTMAGNLGLVAARDLPAFYSCFVLMTFAAYGLVIHSGEARALRAGRVYLVMAILGEVLLLAGMLLVAAEGGSLLLTEMSRTLSGMDHRSAALGLLLAGFGVKAGAVPLYFWLPLAHPVAPAPASAVLSGAMIKAGLLGWVHFSPAGHAELPGWGALLLAAGLLAAFGAAGAGLLQSDPKANLAYSSISQMGLLTVLVGIGLFSAEAWERALPSLALGAWNHGLAKGALFLGVGVALAAGRRGWVFAGLALAAASLAGAPFTGGAFAKYGILGAAETLPGIWPSALAWLLPLSSLATSLLLGRFLWLCWRKAGSGTGRGCPAAARVSWIALLALVAAGTPWARIHFGLDTPAPAAGAVALLGALWPLAAAAVLLLAGARWLERRGRSLPELPPGDVVVWLERGLAALRSGWRRKGLPDLRNGAIDLVPVVDRLIALEGARGLVDRAERRLGAWSVAGLLFALIALGLIGLLA